MLQTIGIIYRNQMGDFSHTRQGFGLHVSAATPLHGSILEDYKHHGITFPKFTVTSGLIINK